MGLLQEKRGRMKDMLCHGRRDDLRYEVPFAEILYDFHDRLKSMTRGYASMDYDPIGYQPGKLVRVDILVNEERDDALSVIAHTDKAHELGRQAVASMPGMVHRQLIPVPGRAA